MREMTKGKASMDMLANKIGIDTEHDVLKKWIEDDMHCDACLYF